MSRHLPNSIAAQVEERKIIDYLLNPAHPDGGSKAKFFLTRGFAVADWKTMRAALTTQGSVNPVTGTVPHPWGTRYQVDCHCPTPDGANPCIRSIWELPSAAGSPRLLTAYPLSN